MNDHEYNLYIENYLKNDKTKSAIMLIAPWGMGKSYYIQNSLIPHLEHDGDKKCVVVSLYGLNDIKEISKAIYFELRVKKIGSKNEKFEAGKIVAKTLLKNGLSTVGIDLSVREEDLEKLYTSIDLSDKLIILEDLERSGISIKQVLGYVNNLVEQDGAKVLLVANENEVKDLEEKITKDKEGKDTTKWVYTAETEEYLKIKEKTVSDTIHYLCDFDAAIENILKTFSDPNLNTCLEEKDTHGKALIVNEIRSVMADVGVYNLRSLIFACQKTVDIFLNYKNNLDIVFFKHVLLGNLAFSLRLKSNDDLKWGERTNPNSLGTSEYPLYKFCYDYIKYQELDVSEIKSNQETFIERKEYEKKQQGTNTALSILYDFPNQKSVILGCAVEMVRDELKDGTVIPVIQYGKLANYLIAVRSLLDNPDIIDECKTIMLQNLKKVTHRDGRILDRLRIHDSFSFWDDIQVKEYNTFIQEMSSVFQSNAFSYIKEDDPLEYLQKIAELMYDKESDVRQSKSFMDKIDTDKILVGLEKATATQVSEFRRGFLSTYGIANISDFLPNDKDALVGFQAGVQNLLDSNKGADKIVRLQYLWLIGHIEAAIKNY
ncbi:MAG: hypothetical protein IJ403_09440 [Oscillospiraceae bacterium]|nr:hypothetical protein [Oscillospiraceae bacterium]